MALDTFTLTEELDNGMHLNQSCKTECNFILRSVVLTYYFITFSTSAVVRNLMSKINSRNMLRCIRNVHLHLFD